MTIEAIAATQQGKAPDAVADPADVAEIDPLIKALYLSISAGPTEIRDWLRFKSLFQPEARLIATNPNKAGKPNVRVLSLDEFVTKDTQALAHSGFIESEVKRSVRQFGNVAQVFSSYEIRRQLNGPVIVAGVNALQLYFDGRRWWIASLAWDTDRPGNRLPDDLGPLKP